MPALSVIVPCLNEAESLVDLVGRLETTLASLFPDEGQAEVLLIDDGSTDDTPARMQRLQREFPRVRNIRHPVRLGIPAAWRSGVSAARGSWLCVLDGDLQYEPEQIRRLWEARDDDRADIIQGARAMAERRWEVRLLLSRGLSLLLNVAFGMSLRDNKSGFFLCRRQVLERLLGFEGPYRHWQCFVMVAAHHHGYRIHQVETPFHPRLRGRSAFGRFGLGPALGVAKDLLTAVREYRGVSRS